MKYENFGRNNYMKLKMKQKIVAFCAMGLIAIGGTGTVAIKANAGLNIKETTATWVWSPDSYQG